MLQFQDDDGFWIAVRQLHRGDVQGSRYEDAQYRYDMKTMMQQNKMSGNPRCIRIVHQAANAWQFDDGKGYFVVSDALSSAISARQYLGIADHVFSVHMNGETYSVDLQSGTQINLSTSTVRRIRNTGTVRVDADYEIPEEEFDVEIPDELMCPITNAIMVRPMLAADDKTYELSAIRQWFTRKATSPMTALPVPHTQLKINSDILMKLAAFRAAHSPRTADI